jgi:hypothetical protein
LSCSSYWCSACSRYAWFQINVRSSKLVAAALDPPFPDRVHARHLDTAEHDLDAGVGEDGVEQCRVPAVAVTDEEACPAAGVLQVHREVTHGLGDSGSGRVRSGAQDPYPSGGVLDHREDVHPGPGQGRRFEEVCGGDDLGLGAQEPGPVVRGPLGRWVDAGVF